MIIPSGGEWFWIGLLGVILFGPDKLPGIARTWGRWAGEFNRARMRIEAEIRAAAEEVSDVKLRPAPHLNPPSGPPAHPTETSPVDAHEIPPTTPVPDAEDPYHLVEPEKVTHQQPQEKKSDDPGK